MNGINFILDHFDTFFSLIVHGNKIELPIILRGFSRIHKGKKYLYIYLALLLFNLLFNFFIINKIFILIIIL